MTSFGPSDRVLAIQYVKREMHRHWCAGSMLDAADFARMLARLERLEDSQFDLRYSSSR